MTEQLYHKLTVNRIGNVHYMNYAIKVHITEHLFLPQKTDESSTSFKCLPVQSLLCFSFLYFRSCSVTLVSPPKYFCCVFFCIFPTSILFLFDFHCVLCCFTANLPKTFGVMLKTKRQTKPLLKCLWWR